MEFRTIAVERKRFCGSRVLLVGSAFGLASSPAWPQTLPEKTILIGEVTVESAALANGLTLDGDALAARRFSSSDTASMLPGVDSGQAGGVSSLPMIHGLGDDRIRTLVNGVPVAAACPMHMNPPLSYIDPSNLGRIDVLPGATPVSLGGDNIGGTIVVESAPLTFAAPHESSYRGGSVSSFFRSNGSAIGGGVSATAASSDFSLRYDGSGSRAGDYRDGAGEQINASRFETSNQQITAAYRNGQNLFEVRAALQYMPYEGFPNADMDLTANVGAFLSARYKGGFSWGELSVAAYYDRIRHAMNGNAPDRYPPSLDITGFGIFPTLERGQDFGYRVEAEIATSAQDTVRLGNELHAQTLDDGWPGAPAGMMFDYLNINKATRTQWGTFAEWERRVSDRWTTVLGARNDTVWMDTGPVQGYDGTDPQAAAFNTSKRSRTDDNVDATWLTRYQPDSQQSYSVGLGRKSRSPNLYERYAWGTNTIGTVTWFGDGNGYTGNLDLKPETAHTASASADWHDTTATLWQVKVTGYFSTVQDYIGVVPNCGPACSGMPVSQLMFANHRARLYGADATAGYTFANSAEAGIFRLTAAGGIVHGQDLSTHTDLYHQMPLNGTVALEHQRGNWSSGLQVRVVHGKSAVDEVRSEPPTPGYATVDLRTAYAWRSVRIDLAIANLLDHQYDNPLGGTWQSALYPPGYSGTTFRALPAAGRSLNAGVTVTF